MLFYKKEKFRSIKNCIQWTKHFYGTHTKGSKALEVQQLKRVMEYIEQLEKVEEIIDKIYQDYPLISFHLQVTARPVISLKQNQYYHLNKPKEDNGNN